jgi:DNA-binding response OmpR family regulator
MVQSDGELREMIRRMFRRADIACIEARDADNAVGLVDVARIDAVLLDLSPSRDGKKPDFDGWRIIRAHSTAMPIVLLTTDECVALPQALSCDPMTRTLCKPFGVKALLGVLFGLIDAREMHQ